MASKRHDFIVSSIGRKIREYGFKIIYLDGKFQDLDIKKFNLPPKIIHHKPDIIGEIEKTIFCIGEAKTENDISSERTKTEFIDFYDLVKINIGNKLIIGIPYKAKHALDRLLLQIGLSNKKQIEILYVPEKLFPNEKELSF